MNSKKTYNILIFIYLYSSSLFSWEFIGPTDNLNICNLYSFGKGHILAFEGEINNRNPYLFRSRDYGKTWDTLKNTGLHDSRDIRFIIWYNNQLWAGDCQNGAYYSEDSGNTWIDNDQTGMTYSFAAKDNYFLIGSYCSFYRSTDYGKTFELIYTPQVPHDFGAALSMMEFRGVVYAGTQFGIFASKDWGRTWEMRGKNMKEQGGWITSLQRIDTVIIMSNFAGAYTSYDLGQNERSWIFRFETDGSTILYVLDSSQIYLSYRTSNNTYYCYSTDTDKTYKPFSITTPENYCYEIKSDEKYVYIMTDHGIYRNLKIDSPVNILKKENKTTLERNTIRYVTQNKTIMYSLKSPSAIDISLFKLNGQKIFTYKNNLLPSGKIKIDIKKYTVISGLYIIYVTTNYKNESKLISVE